MRLKRVLGLTAAVVMALGMPLTALADSGSLSGEGEVEAIVDTDVFKVELPTVSASDTTFDFILDPQELLKASGNDAYASGTFALGGHMYFLSAADTYTSNSKVLTATNKSSADVDINVKAELKNHDSIAIVAASAVAAATSPSMYLAIGMPATDTTAVDTSADTMTAMTTSADGVTSASATATIPAVASNYEIKYVTDHYEMAEVSSPAAYKTQSFYIDGAINTLAVASGWKDLQIAQPDIEVTWEIKTPFDPKAAMDATGKIIISGLTGTKNITSQAITVKNKEFGDITFDASNYSWLGNDSAWSWSAEDGGTAVMQLPAAYVAAVKELHSGAGEMVRVTITLSDDSTISCTAVLK